VATLTQQLDIMVTGDADGNGATFTARTRAGDEARCPARWAHIRRRDAHRTRRPMSYLIVLSDGRRIGGELSQYAAERRCVRWIRAGV